MDNQKLLEVIREISIVISSVVKNSKNLGDYTTTIGVGGDQTKVGDQLVEDELRRVVPGILKKYNFNGALVVSEETGIWKVGESNDDSVFLIIDPIDGSNNMRPHHTPHPIVGFSIAAGWMKDWNEDGTLNAIKAGVVRNIFYNEEYSAVYGEGAYVDGIKLTSSPVVDLAISVFGFSLDHLGDKLKAIFDKGGLDLLLITKCQRRLGSTAVDLCRVASGDNDLYSSLTGGAKVHDIAAAQLIIKEAGGTVLLFDKHTGENVTNFKWLQELEKLGNDDLKSAAFMVLAGGNQNITKSAEKFLRI